MYFWVVDDKPQQQETKLYSGINVQNIDHSTRPQDDFYQYANGTWLSKTEIPADKSSYSTFTALRDKSTDDIKAIIDNLIQLKNSETGSETQKIADLYSSFMDTERLNRLGASPLTKALQTIEHLKTYNDIANYFGESQIMGIDAPFGFWISNDLKKPNSYIAYFTQSGLGLPDKKNYLKKDKKSKKLRSDYVSHIAKMLAITNIDKPQLNANRVMAVEVAIAEIHWTRVQRRDTNSTYNKIAISSLSKLTPSFSWTGYLKKVGLSNESHIIVREKSYFEDFSALFETMSIADWKAYFKWNLINASAERLSDDFEQQNFAFYSSRLRGTLKQEARWKRGVDVVSEMLSELVGKLYVANNFRPEAKAKMLELVENLRMAYKQAIVDLDWMSELTKQQALDKLSKFTPKVGYPEQWRDYSSLEIKANDLYGNYQRAALFNHARQIAKLGKPLDLSEWIMSPQTVNAYYNPGMNEIVFPAAILQPPFFNMEADDAVNYGAIGAVIGHEMSHGFDDQGAKSDGNGILRNWWTDSDFEEFKKRSHKLAEQFSGFEPLPGVNINGQMTLGENIGDLGGLTVAHSAYMLSQKQMPSTTIDGLTGEQRFFIGWAQIWANKFREEVLRSRLSTAPHPPSKYRSNGTLMNMPEFMKAYNVEPGDGMYRAPEDRVKIW